MEKKSISEWMEMYREFEARYKDRDAAAAATMINLHLENAEHNIVNQDEGVLCEGLIEYHNKWRLVCREIGLPERCNLAFLTYVGTTLPSLLARVINHLLMKNTFNGYEPKPITPTD